MCLDNIGINSDNKASQIWLDFLVMFSLFSRNVFSSWLTWFWSQSVRKAGKNGISSTKKALSSKYLSSLVQPPVESGSIAMYFLQYISSADNTVSILNNFKNLLIWVFLVQDSFLLGYFFEEWGGFFVLKILLLQIHIYKGQPLCSP